MSHILDIFTKDALDAARANNTYRTMRLMETPESSCVKIRMPNGASQEQILLASNSYLDLANVDELKQAMAQAVLEWGTGSGGARLTTGNKTPHQELEEFIAKFKGEESAITFNTGYMANVGTISALCGKNDFVFSDELNHASIIDGIRLSRAKCLIYKHNDMADLERVIKEAAATLDVRPFRGLIVTDAVFSMDGDLANLPELLRIAKENDCLLMIDEAHATGVLGKTGRGLAEHYGCAHADVTVGTLSKAIAAEGGFVAGKQQLIDFLRNKARSFIFTTAMAPAVAAAACNNLRYIDAHPERVQNLRNNVKFFCEALQHEGVKVEQSPSAIVPIVIGDEARALEISAALQNAGILIPAIRYPTVAKGQARLRASLMATHTHEQLQTAATVIAQAVKECV
ncbi:glycine C-acetyltransferase/8-amino-7-oxononanoate synthase [Fibrobacter sp. UWB15]|uniref:8-amino-7-oxononanoate synthase n=1 Tax=unclassified Fibrobacter TaxID=2634177 RepID=UPI0009145689|nr:MULTISPECIES: 8-amino-7-oxononanoate synthase [unclassified Fibrobacter]PWJ65846.1 glycine C-acetyltransferase/8-amino-7-oxononanoate synthase [Fibrobacter sp. UWB6]SHF91864.1 glycine C-acetyltransferase/8-amino-7-oxononanoate synthase [Fibrobacter sp. UWB8]SMG26335.1 glycine C-acetyltransferase/8-amino-7-oxononanoate synthase [Fibrobacter sp. UWB15]